MPNRTAYPATESAGDTLTTTNFDKLPGGWIGYAEVTANQTSVGAAPTDLTSLSITVTVNTTRRIRVTGSVRFTNDTSAKASILYVYESSTQLQRAQGKAVAAGDGFSVERSVILTPTGGSHTYKLRAESEAGSTSTMVASSDSPAFILVEDIGPAS